MTRTIRATSTEYLTFTVTADKDISSDTFDLWVDSGVGWLAAEKVSATGATATIRLLVGPGASRTLGLGVRTALVRIHDIPETPVVPAGTIAVIA